MTFHTPVVFTDDDDVAAAARARHWPVVRRHGTTLSLSGVQQSIPVPEPTMDIAGGSLVGQHVAGWKLVLNWLEKYLHRPMLVVEPDGWVQDLALWSAASRGWPFGVWVHGTQPEASSPGAVALLTSSAGVFFIDETERDQCTTGWPFPVAVLADAALVDVPKHPAPTPSVRREGVTRVLLVSYSVPTSGASRSAQLWEALLQGSDITVDLATAVPHDGQDGRVHHVPDLGAATLAPRPGPIDTWATAAFTQAADKAYGPTHHVAGYWQVALERYFADRPDHFDVVIITGDTVESFGFAAFAQRQWYARTVLDYGQPEALAARRALTGDASREAEYWERGWNMAAELVTVADDASLAWVQRSGPDAEILVVPDSGDATPADSAWPALVSRLSEPTTH